ncbi:transferase, TIGR04331 family [Leptospira wolbachii serovar Codice str. CDC]|uniref:Transferase, TIGR04331 family n=1 Tax=Leptospira wolbachii serovar Codice str. CDC TaxID=1218599 RepID=R9A7J5_9LEPT|nr:LIC12162 family protein [Leptospira wolbachii]EOQ97994.1 transferase, TIGR04331 family [Leptospira wolbachii serovar Codice str. CDC]
MSKKVLITTALESTWFSESSVVFLGEWCKLYHRKREWEKLDFEVIPYHWRDRSKLGIDHDYLKEFYERILIALVQKLNIWHGLEEEEKFWRILIGPWLLTYVSVIWDRWENLRIAFQKEDSYHTAVSLNSLNFAEPSDYSEFLQFIGSDLWNFRKYQEILLFQYKEKINPLSIEELFVFQEQSYRELKKVGLKQKLVNLVDKIGSLFDSKTKKVLFFHSYFNRKNFYLLNFFLNQLPRSYASEFEFEIGAHEKSLFRLESIPFDPKNSFEDFVLYDILKEIPQSYLESFSDLYYAVRKIKYQPKIIFTANAHFWHEPFKLWMAQASKENTKLVISSHGGSIPPKMSMFNHEEDISNCMVTWFKAANLKQRQLPPSKIIEKRISRRGRYCTMIGMELLRYAYRAEAAPMSSLVIDHFDDTVTFCNSLSDTVSKDLQIWPYPNQGWDTKNRYTDIFGREKISLSKSYQHIYSDSRFIVCTYPQTTFSEAMASGRPTILLLMDFFETDPVADELLEILKLNKIIFTDPILAANHVSSVWDDLDSWWESDSVKIAREKFNEVALGGLSNNWLFRWSKFFNQLIIESKS